jgi:hypothetical protein
MLGGSLAALAMITGAPSAHADDSAAAQALFDQAKHAMAAQNYDEACPKFAESQRLDPALGTLLNLADCYEREGKLATAWSKFLELGTRARAAGQADRAQIGKQRAAALAPRLPYLTIVVGASAAALHPDVLRDRGVVGAAEFGTAIPVDPGMHTVSASASGRIDWSTTVAVTEGHTQTVTVPELAAAPEAPVATASAAPSPAAPTPLPAEPPTPTQTGGNGLGAQRGVAIGAGVLGLAGIAVGTYFGVDSINKHNDATDACATSQCKTQAGVNLWSDARQAGNISTIAFVVGGVALAGGIVLWFTAPHRAETTTAQLGVGPGSLQLRGTW